MSAAVECPLCLEKMDIDDLAFFPCSCRYQICRFCWNRIRTEENGLCPACREVYTDQPSTDFNSISNGSIDFRTTNKKKRKDLTKSKNIGDMMKVLPELRVVQPNLIFVIGLPPWMSKERDQLSKDQYFGKFGKVFKVEINQNQTFTGPQGSSSISAYVTYHRAEDAMHAITELDQTYLHSRQLRVSLGTTKYCSQFLKGSKCTKHECMYLHELGDPEASFTKEQMQNGKHTDYMNKLLRDYSQNNATSGKSGFGFADTEMMHEHEKEYEECNLSDTDNVSPQIIQPTNPQSNGLQTPASKASSQQPVKTNQPVNPATPSNNTSTVAANAVISANSNNQNSKNRQKTPISLRKQTVNCPKGKEKGDNKLNDSIGIHLDDNADSEMRNSSNQFIFGHHQHTFNDEDSNVDIDFDPFSISQNGLAELLAAEQDRISRLNNNNTNNNNMDNSVSNHWPPSSIATNPANNNSSNNQGINTSVQNNNVAMRTFQQPPIGVCIQRLGHGEGSGAVTETTSSRVIHPPPGFEEKPIQTVTCVGGQQTKQSTTTSHPPGLVQLPDHDMKVSQNYAVNSMSTPSKVASSNPLNSSTYDHSSRELCQNSLVKALDLACIAFRIALTLDNQDDDNKYGIDLNTFLLHLSDNTGIDYIRLQSAIAKSSKVSCILSSTHSSSSTSSNNNNNNNTASGNNNNSSASNGINGKLESSKFNGIFQQLSRPTNDDLLRHNSLWSGSTRDNRAMMESSHMNTSSTNPMASTNGGKANNHTSSSLLLQQSSQATNLIPPPLPPGIGANNASSLFTSQGSPNIQNFDLHSKHSQSSNNSNNNNTWHIDDPAIVSGRFTLQDSSETNIRSCLWQPTTSQPSFMNPQSSNIVRQMNFNNMSNANQSLTWSHSHLHQSQPNQTSDNSDTNVPDKKHQTIFHSYATTTTNNNNNNTMESSIQKLSGGSRHLQNVIKNFSVS